MPWGRTTLERAAGNGRPGVTPGAYEVDPKHYDVATANITADVAPHVAMMRSAGGPALEVCCGNGRLLIPTLEAGVACEGLDFDAPMLDDLRAKLAARGLSATLHQ